MSKRIESYNVSWIADHEQYWRGHGTAFTEYTHSATGVGETLREGFEDAIHELCLLEGPQGTELNRLEIDMLADLTAQVKEPGMLDWDIVQGYCAEQGEHKRACPHSDPEHMDDDDDHSTCAYCENTGEVIDENPDCAVCAGEWHYYVNIDVEVVESEVNA